MKFTEFKRSIGMDKKTATLIAKTLKEAYDVKHPFVLTPRRLAKGLYAVELSIRQRQLNVGELTEYETICYTREPARMAAVIEALSYCQR